MSDDDVLTLLSELEADHNDSLKAGQDAVTASKSRKRKRSSRDESLVVRERLQLGVVLLKGFLTEEEQGELAAFGLKLIQSEPRAKNEVLKSMKQITLGNTRSETARLPPLLGEIAADASSMAAEVASELVQLTKPQTVVINWYCDKKSSLGMHVDKKGRRKGVPVVSISLGDSCDFVFKKSWSKKESNTTVRLDSGDVLLFGGPAEGIVHSVPRTHFGTGPPFLAPLFTGRLNITCRDHQ